MRYQTGAEVLVLIELNIWYSQNLWNNSCISKAVSDRVCYIGNLKNVTKTELNFVSYFRTSCIYMKIFLKCASLLGLSFDLGHNVCMRFKTFSSPFSSRTHGI